MAKTILIKAANYTKRACVCSFMLLIGLIFSVSLDGKKQAVWAQNIDAEQPVTLCINTNNIDRYKIETDDIIRLFMKSGEAFTMRLKRQCPQLRFHGYLSYTPTNGKLCTDVDEVTTRSGLKCRISSIKVMKLVKKASQTN